VEDSRSWTVAKQIALKCGYKPIELCWMTWLFPVDNYRDILSEFLSKIILPDLVFLFFMHENLPTLSNELSMMEGSSKMLCVHTNIR